MLLGLIARINFAKILLISSSLNIVWYVYFFPKFFFIVHGTILCRARFLTQGWVICQADIYHPQNSDICHPQIRTFTTPKNRTFARRTTATPNFSFFFSGARFLAFSTYSSWRTSRMGRRRCLMRWSWGISSRRCVTRWSWSTSSRRCLTSWSWSTSSRGRRWKRSPRW